MKESQFLKSLTVLNKGFPLFHTSYQAKLKDPKLLCKWAIGECDIWMHYFSQGYQTYKKFTKPRQVYELVVQSPFLGT